jgi:hypothetical protein
MFGAGVNLCGSMMITVNSLTQKYIFMVTGNIRDLDRNVVDDPKMRKRDVSCYFIIRANMMFEFLRLRFFVNPKYR